MAIATTHPGGRRIRSLFFFVPLLLLLLLLLAVATPHADAQAPATPTNDSALSSTSADGRTTLVTSDTQGANDTTTTTSSSSSGADGETSSSSPSVGMEVLRYAGIVVLVSMSSIFSGLTLGLMSLDKTALEVVIGAGRGVDATADEMRNAMYAERILPVRMNGNQLLTTLILGNVMVNSVLSILMADLTSGLMGFLVSTAVIVVFGEIMPQAICSRYALAVGARLVPLVKVVMVICFVVARPVSLLLDAVLGADVGMIFSKRELAKLLEIHVRRNMLLPHEGHILRGAMGYRQKRVCDIMASATLNMATIKAIYEMGFSRVPVWDKNPNDIIGVIFVKDLVLVDPREDVPLRSFVHVFARAAHRVWLDAPLGEVLQAFKGGSTHMALVYEVNNKGPGDPFYELQGVLTLEDIVEEILQDKIVDDTDSPDAHRVRKLCADRMTMDYGIHHTPRASSTRASSPSFKSPFGSH